jgi:hypothetical protein
MSKVGESATPSGQLWTALHALDRYLSGQSDWLVNYAERYRAGPRLGTALTEGTANFLVNSRCAGRDVVPTFCCSFAARFIKARLVPTLGRDSNQPTI